MAIMNTREWIDLLFAFFSTHDLRWCFRRQYAKHLLFTKTDFKSWWITLLYKQGDFKKFFLAVKCLSQTVIFYTCVTNVFTKTFPLIAVIETNFLFFTISYTVSPCWSTNIQKLKSFPTKHTMNTKHENRWKKSITDDFPFHSCVFSVEKVTLSSSEMNWLWKYGLCT